MQHVVCHVVGGPGDSLPIRFDKVSIAFVLAYFIG